MPIITSGIIGDSNTFNLKEIPFNKVRKEIENFLVEDEDIIGSFATIRDQVIFTDKRIFVINVQGLVGKKVSYLSYPYKKVQYFGVETAGVLDIDSELVLVFNDGSKLSFDFRSNVDIVKICQSISSYIL